MGFCVKELFHDINQSDISLLNKALKAHMNLYGREPSKRTLPGEKWPSNEWPDELKTIACCFLILHRRDVRWEEIRETQIDYPFSKGWGFGVPNYNGEWEPHDEKLLGFKLGLDGPEEEPDDIPSIDDDFMPELGSEEMKTRNNFLDMLDEIK